METAKAVLAESVLPICTQRLSMAAAQPQPSATAMACQGSSLEGVRQVLCMSWGGVFIIAGEGTVSSAGCGSQMPLAQHQLTSGVTAHGHREMRFSLL